MSIISIEFFAAINLCLSRSRNNYKRVYEHVYESYWGDGAGKYAQGAA